MKKQAFNPFLPSWEYVPDGEPHVFGDRVYLYGSHDRFGGDTYCLNDYVCWSAPLTDLADWRCEGVIYRKDADPLNRNGLQYLYAPDVCRGADGRYYLYYVLHAGNVTSVAVCDTPAGEYQFYGHVRYPDGHISGTRAGDTNNFDPGVFRDDDGRIYLYSGFSPNFDWYDGMYKRGYRIEGAFVLELEPDMLTVKSQRAACIVPGTVAAQGTEFEVHPFYEASSMRKIGGKYYFLYSSVLSHELCWAFSDRPDGGFRFGGVVVSNGDVGFDGRRDAINYTGNTHGSLAKLGENWYIFYHRQTNRTEYSRQACAEKVTVTPDGRILQAEITSCGLNGAPLDGRGRYASRIACNLSAKDGTVKSVPEQLRPTDPCFTQSGTDRELDGDQYIAGLCDGAWCAFKYFRFSDAKRIAVCVRSSAGGTVAVSVSRDGKAAAEIAVQPCAEWTEFSAPLCLPDGIHALYFTFHTAEKMDFSEFILG